MNYLTTVRSRDIPSLFNDLFFRDFFGNDDFFSPLPTLKKIDYPVDIYETEEGLNIDVAAVGLDKQDVKIDIKDDVLTVSHAKKGSTSVKEEKYAYRGITQKSFKLAWRINEKFDLTKTNASLDKGLLKIVIPVAPEKKPTQIEITVE